MPIAAGDVLLSRYRAEKLRGRGGMGEVWSCFDLEERRTVAVKLVLAELVTEAWVRRLFHAEVVAVARLSHPGIVDVYDLLQLPDGSSLLVMEYRAGRPLDRALRSGRTWPEVRQVLVQLLDALAHAHARAVLHLDLKPPNVLVERVPAIVTTLVDFGIARILRPGRGAETWFEDGSTVGTPEYMSPEQWFGDVARLGPWSDLYSVGVLAHELCSGRLPNQNDVTAVGATRRRLLEPTPPLEPSIDGVPRDFIALCDQLLSLKATERPHCAADVLAAIEAMDSSVVYIVPPTTPPAPLHVDPSARIIPAPPDSNPGSSISPSGRIGPATARLRLGPETEEAFNAESALPTPGAYGLFGLRELPVLGRVEERRALWNAVHATAASHDARAVILSGPAGTGKSRLARDAVERALELGLATELHTHWSAGGSPDEGLRGLAENAFESRGSQGPDFDSRLAFFVERFPAEATAFQAEAKVLLRPDRDAAPDAGLPLRVATDVVVRVASSRPVILRLDDIQWNRGEAAQLIRALGAARPAFGVCIVATEREHDAASDHVEALDAYGGETIRVAMQPLGADATRALVRGLLDLDDELADVVARRSEGNPLFASQLVGQLVLERAVERKGGRYVLARSVDVARVVPPDMRAVWSRGVKASGADESDLMVFALVRERVSGEVIDALAALVGDRFNASFSKALGAGLIRKEGDLYAFSHGLLRDYLVARITPAKAPPLHAIAADALRVLVGREDVEEARAFHLRSAGRDQEAMESMLAAALWSWRRAERAHRERRLLQLVAWSSPEDPAGQGLAIHARALAELAQHHGEGGAFDQANALLDRVRAAVTAAAADPAYESCAAWAAFREGQVMRLQGRVDAGATLSQRGIEHAERAGEHEVEALCRAQLGLDAYRRGDWAVARHLYDAGIDLMRRAGNRATEAQISMMKSATEEPVPGEALSRAAVEMAREVGALRIEIAARQAWTEALYRVGERELYRQQTAELSALAQRRGLRQIVSMVEGVAACWAVLEGELAAAEAHRALAVKWGALTGAAPERATLAAVDVALAIAGGDDVIGETSLAVLVREGRTYREPHFVDIVRHLLTIAPEGMRTTLRELDAASADA